MKKDLWEIYFPYHKAMESEKWMKQIPFIQFPTEWKIKIIPPFGGAVIRFFVQLPHQKGSDLISVYLDCYEVLGACNKPYWEVYPYENDVGRCYLDDVDELLRMISSNAQPHDPRIKDKSSRFKSSYI